MQQVPLCLCLCLCLVMAFAKISNSISWTLPTAGIKKRMDERKNREKPSEMGERAKPLSHKREMKIRGVWNLHLSLDSRRRREETGTGVQWALGQGPLSTLPTECIIIIGNWTTASKCAAYYFLYLLPLSFYLSLFLFYCCCTRTKYLGKKNDARTTKTLVNYGAN